MMLSLKREIIKNKTFYRFVPAARDLKLTAHFSKSIEKHLKSSIIANDNLRSYSPFKWGSLMTVDRNKFPAPLQLKGMMKQMNKLSATLYQALMETGPLLKRAMQKPKKFKYKGHANLVTVTDKAAEKKIIRIIKRRFPDHGILAEESAESDDQTHHENQWIIDPIDGTTNFAHGLPMAAISIGFEHKGKMRLGAVYNPFLNELFWAEQDKGAFLNGKRIHVSRTRSLHAALLVTGFPYDRHQRANRYMKVVETFLRNTHGIRRLGSASLDLCYVACGRFDGYWESKLKPWDQAAGYLIAKEAGARCTDFRGGPFGIYQKETLVTNGRIHRAMVKIVSKYL